jgi:hypothetical protein
MDKVHYTDVEQHLSLKDLAKQVSDLRYDALLSFIKYLSTNIKEDGLADCKRGRNKLGLNLLKVACALSVAYFWLKKVDSICKRHY